MPANNILLFSRPIRTGKTTELQNFISGKENIGGFLMPDVDGQRMLYDIAADTCHPFELPENSEEPALTIGKFRFAIAAFKKAKSLFVQEKDWLVVDEVGKLEVLQHTGLEPELLTLIAAFQSGQLTGKLLLVVRDTLLEAAIRKYGLDEAHVLDSLLGL